MGTLSALLEQLAPEPVERGRQFEQICKWYLENEPLYAREFDKVWLWRDWPGRWTQSEAGIDLVARAFDGSLWAVQAKAYDPRYSIRKKDVDSFLSESSREVFAARLLIATTDRLGATARRTLEAQAKPALRRMRSDLDALHLEWPSSPNQLRVPSRARAIPWDDQREAVAAVVRGYESHDRGQLILPCGTGKTLTSLFIAERLKAKRILILVPSISLLEQTLQAWAVNAPAEFEFMPVCSDESVASSDDVVERVSDLGVPVTTDPVEISRFLRRRGPRVVISTYQSSPRLAQAFACGHVPRFDLAVADEAHRCAGRVGSDFGTVLDADAIRAKRRLFMTATPRFFTGRVVRESRQADWELASMDDQTVFGPVLHRMTFVEAIDLDLLSDYRVAIIGVDDDTYLSWVERGDLLSLNGQEIVDARAVASQIGLAKAIRRYGLRRVISFHSRITRAKEFSSDLLTVIDWVVAQFERPGTGYIRAPVWSEHRTACASHM